MTGIGHRVEGGGGGRGSRVRIYIHIDLTLNLRRIFWVSYTNEKDLLFVNEFYKEREF